MSLAIPQARRARRPVYRRGVWVLALRATLVVVVLVGWASLSGDLVAGWRAMPRR